MTGKPLVLVIDDRPDDQGLARARALSRGGTVTAKTFHPDELRKADIRSAAVMLVDYVLEDWPGRALVEEPALQPKNGLALAGVLREHLNQNRTAAICILSNQLSELYGGLSPENRRHVLARVHSLEWIFSKTDPNLGSQVEELALAVISINESSNRKLDWAELLGLSDEAPFRELAKEEVRRCVPPVDELNELTHGVSFLRWLLQRVLPYPTFLIDDSTVAAMFKIDVAALATLLKGKGEFAKHLRNTAYCGILSEFGGRRWWRAGITTLMWETAQQDSMSPELWLKKLRQKTTAKLRPTKGWPDPVVLVDENHALTEMHASREASVRIVPDDWPSYASSAFVTIDEARKSRALKAIVHPDDLWRLET